MALKTEDKQEDQEQQAPPTTGNSKDAGEREGTRAERLLDQIIARYGAEPEGIAKGVLQLSPSDRDDVMHVIHQRFGNGFVHQVEIAIGKLNQEREGQPAPEPMTPPTEAEKAAAEQPG